MYHKPYIPFCLYLGGHHVCVKVPFIFIDFCIFGAHALARSTSSCHVPKTRVSLPKTNFKFQISNTHPRGAGKRTGDRRPPRNGRPARPGRPSGPRRNRGRMMTVKAEDDGMEGEQLMMAAKDAVEGRDVRGGKAVMIRNLKS